MATNNSAETFAIGEYTRKADGKPLLALKLWANGRATNSVVMADSPEHLVSILAAALAYVKTYTPTAKYHTDVAAYVGKNAAKPAAVATVPDLAAIMAEIQRLQAENARLAGTPTTAVAAPIVAAATNTQARLSRIKTRAK